MVWAFPSSGTAVNLASRLLDSTLAPLSVRIWAQTVPFARTCAEMVPIACPGGNSWESAVQFSSCCCRSGPPRSSSGRRPRTADAASWWSFALYSRCRVTARVVTPTMTQIRASSPRTVTTSRARSDQPDRNPVRPGRWDLVCGLEDIASAAQRVDHGGPPGVDLLAQVRDVQLDHVGLAA